MILSSIAFISLLRERRKSRPAWASKALAFSSFKTDIFPGSGSYLLGVKPRPGNNCFRFLPCCRLYLLSLFFCGIDPFLFYFSIKSPISSAIEKAVSCIVD